MVEEKFPHIIAEKCNFWFSPGRQIYLSWDSEKLIHEERLSGLIW